MGKFAKLKQEAARLAQQKADAANGNMVAKHVAITLRKDRLEKGVPVLKMEWVPLLAHGHTFFFEITGISLVAGAERKDYPKMEDIPEQFRSNRTDPCVRAGQKLFFNGGTFESVGRKAKEGINGHVARAYVQMLNLSFEPSHELKSATVGMCIDAWTDPIETE